MKIKKNATPEVKDQGNAKKESKNIQKNVESKLKDFPKTSAISSPSLYRIEGWENFTDKQKKTYRRKMRTQLRKFMQDILGKDRSNDERKKSVKEFQKFFKDNYISSTLDASAIYSGNDAGKRKDYEDMIAVINATK